MSSQVKQSFIFIVLGAILANCQPKALSYQANKTPQQQLLGTWAMQEIHWITPKKTYTIKNAQPGYIMFQPQRYALMWTPTQSPRKPFKVLAKPSEKETIAGFRSVVFNTGTYQVHDSLITTTATLAKVPGFEGGKQFYKYHLKDDSLTLHFFDETYPNGQKPEWYGKMTTKFILKKIAQ
ncbi:hypothetical protein BKI52_22255 [marine bacterium AO1-C]|nr:hypothetical protein BKI52_22255 [marine bacterium AO1-C]